MSVAPYPDYKDCGISWLGSLPSHWRLKQLKHVAAVIPSNVDKHSKDGENSVSLCNYTDVYYRDRITDEIDFMRATASRGEIERFRLLADDVVVTKDSETADDIGVPSYVPDALPGVICGYHLSIIRPTTQTTGRFLKYVLHSDPTRYYFEISAKGLTRVGLSQGALGNTPIPTPPRREQEVIADFLDHETAQIDALIAEQKRLIGLIREKQNAVVSHVVVKGLDANVEMQHSGRGWLGNIPAHWQAIPLRRVLCSIEQGWSPQADSCRAAENQWGVIKLSAINGGRFHPDESKAIPDGLEVKRNLEIRNGDFLLTRANTPDLVGDVAVVNDVRPKLILSDLCYRLYLADHLDPNYLRYVLRSAVGRYQISRSAHGTSGSMVKVSHEKIKSWLVPLPLFDEQREIVRYLDEEFKRLDAARRECAKGIDKLLERRSALISSAVTGKIDVRDRSRSTASTNQVFPQVAEKDRRYG